jgi:hypothetical protein
MVGVVMVLKKKDYSSVTSSVLICKIIPQWEGEIDFIFILCIVVMTLNQQNARVRVRR